MMKPLRKRHLQTWIAIAVLLPVGIIFSWLAIPNPVPVKILSASTVELLPVIQAKKETNQYCINIRSNSEKTNWQLEWKNKQALTVPSAVIYRASLEFHSQPSPPSGGSVASEGGVSRSFIPNNSQLIGRIESRGDYVFPLKYDTTESKELSFLIYDFIHDKTVDYITFKILRRKAD